MSSPSPAVYRSTTKGQSFCQKINTRWHRISLHVFMLVVLAHWAEHIAQAWQIYVLGWPRHHAGGVLGLRYPRLVDLELLHYSYALIMLIGIWLLRGSFVGLARKWWTVALVIQMWHHFEHLLLIGQVAFRHNLFNLAMPTSILQLFFPRVELHLFYNTIVFIPMVAGLYYHMLPPKGETHRSACNCSWRRREFLGAG